jgi:hypothetical protein
MSMILHGTVGDNTVALDRKTATPLIINGDMQIAQRGTSFTVGTANPYVTDRWLCVGDGASVFTVTQDTDVPTGQGFSKSLKWDTTTAESSLASGSAVLFMQKFEGQNLQMFKKGTSNAEAFTVSFWVKSAKTGVHILQMRDNDNSRQQSQSYTVASANTWEKHVVSFVADTTGAFDNDNAGSLDFMWWLSAGSNFTSGTLATSWESVTNANRAVGQVNVADNTANNWYITGVQLEVGTFDSNSIPDFQFEDRATSLARCQRYFQKLGGSAYTSIGTGILKNARTRTRSHVPYNTTMRSAPTLSIDGTLIVTERETFETDISSIDGSVAGVNGAYINFAHSASGTALYPALITAKGGTTSFLELSSEL